MTLMVRIYSQAQIQGATEGGWFFKRINPCWFGNKAPETLLLPIYFFPFYGDLHFIRNAQYGAFPGTSGAAGNRAIVTHRTILPVTGISTQWLAYPKNAWLVNISIMDIQMQLAHTRKIIPITASRGCSCLHKHTHIQIYSEVCFACPSLIP